MGRSKFRLSDMILPAWLRKLKHPGSALSNARSLLPPQDDSRFRHEPPPHPLSPVDQPRQRKSYHFSRQFDAAHPHQPPSPPKRSTTNKHRRSTHLGRPSRPRRVTSAVSAGCSCRTLADSDHMRTKPECRFPISPSSSPSSTDTVFPQSSPSFGHSSVSVPSSESFCQMISRTTTDSSCRCRADLDDPVMLEEGFDHDPLFELELEIPAVITKPPEFNEMVMNLRRRGENKKPIGTSHHEDSGSSLDWTSAVLGKVVEEETYNRTVRANKEQKQKKPPRPAVNSASSPAGGMRLRVNSPKLVTRNLNQARLQGRKSANTLVSSCPGKNLRYKARKSGISDGLAVVKTSVDPWKDFRESMVEMIVENDIRESKDLEELLARYLMLNSDDYHDLIVRVFKQIWFEFYSAQSK